MRTAVILLLPAVEVRFGSIHRRVILSYQPPVTETTAANTNITTPVMSPPHPMLPPSRDILTISRLNSSATHHLLPVEPYVTELVA